MTYNTKNNTKRISFYKKKNYDLVSVFRDTVNYCKKINFALQPAIKYDQFDTEFLENEFLEGKIAFDGQPIIFVDNIDSFDMAIKIGETNSPILVLNLASSSTSGGGVRRGARAQEEDLYRKSNYFEANSQDLYPMTMTQVIYSSLVHIIKNSNYQLLKKPFIISCLAVAAIKNPPIIKSNDNDDNNNNNDNNDIKYAKDSDKKIMQEKINMIFKVAIKHGHTNLVLGALGCGVYKNPNREVAVMFRNSIDTYGKYFERIGFAVLSDRNNTNYKIFKEIITNCV
jgi:uncharacterized protein (TIGR02452 family)